MGQNGFVSSIRAKRAWAEIDTEFGSIRFGRMPWHWGRGIFYNQGTCADCDVGTTVDRVMGLTTLYGHQFALAWDLGAQGPTTQQLSLGRNDPSGYPYDLSQNDDVLQLMASVTRIDNPMTLRERDRPRRHRRQLRRAARLPAAGQQSSRCNRCNRGARRRRATGRSRRRRRRSARPATTAPGRSRPTSG